jgi:hypothetical protein
MVKLMDMLKYKIKSAVFNEYFFSIINVCKNYLYFYKKG